MAEGVKNASGAIAQPAASGAPGSKIPPQPAPDPELAPRGWRWDAPSRRWVARLSPGRKPRGATHDIPEVQPGARPGPDGSAPPADEPGRDPEPAWAAAERAGQARLPFDQVPQEVKDDIAGAAGLIGIPILALLQRADPYCGTALAENFEPIIDAALPLVCRSEKIVKYFSGDGADWLLWCKLAMALKPVGVAILEHHVVRTVEIARDEQGRRYARPRSRDAGPDHLQPPAAPEFSYAA